MKIIKKNENYKVKRITCDGCGSIFEFSKGECHRTGTLGIIHDGLGEYNIGCPVCKQINYFSW